MGRHAHLSAATPLLVLAWLAVAAVSSLAVADAAADARFDVDAFARSLGGFGKRDQHQASYNSWRKGKRRMDLDLRQDPEVGLGFDVEAALPDQRVLVAQEHPHLPPMLSLLQHLVPPEPRKPWAERPMLTALRLINGDADGSDDDDDADDAAPIELFSIGRRSPYSQWRKAGRKRSVTSSKREYRDWRKGKRATDDFKQWRKTG